MEQRHKSLIEVVKQVEALGVKYLELHKNEIPIFNPIESGLRDVGRQLKSAISGKIDNLSKLDKLSEKSKRKSMAKMKQKIKGRVTNAYVERGE